jgi:HEAT repeat protein
VATAGTSRAPRAPVPIERFVKQLNVTFRAVRLYPETSELRRDNAVATVASLNQALREQPLVLLTVTREGLSYDGASIFPQSGTFTSFAHDFYNHQLTEVRFHAGCTAEEILAFLGLLDLSPDRVSVAGGFAAGLWERNVADITVSEASSIVMDADASMAQGPLPAPVEGAEGEPWPPSPERMDEYAAGAAAGRPRERRLLVRAMSHAHVLAGYLRESSSGRGVPPTDAELTARIGMLAHSADAELPEEREALLRALAEAVLDLDPDLRQRLLAGKLLGEARRDGTIAAVVRQMSLDEVMSAILEQIPSTDEARAGLSRAIRNLALINLSMPREEVLRFAGEAMRAHGMTEADTGSVLAGAAPSHLETRGALRSSDAEPVESVIRLLDLTPGASNTYAYDEGVGILRADAARGLTDGDVLSALVTIATLETRDRELANITALLDESLGLLVDQQEFEVAADAAEALMVVAADPGIGDEHRRKMTDLVRLLARPETMRSITNAMRVYRHDSVEHDACRRLLGALGSQTIAPLLEVMAEEADMAARKAIVDLVSRLAAGSVSELGHRVEDRRWYFVRNVVAILGATRDPQALQYLERTLRHADARVRRETIRAAANIRDARSDAMLVGALADADAANVQLAARYLGTMGTRGAAHALEQVARGEGRGNRENGPRIDAIEALGRIGEPSSVPVLEDIERQRGLIAGRTRDVRAAASTALAVLRRRIAERGRGE